MTIAPDDIVEYLCRKAPRVVHAKELYRDLGVAAADRRGVKRMLRDLSDSGAVIRVKGARYGAPRGAKRGRLRGVFRGHPKGFGFVSFDDADMEDVYVPPPATGGALHGDEVEVRVDHPALGPRRSGEIVRIVTRRHREIIGQFIKARRPHAREKGALAPYDQRINVEIVVPWHERAGAEPGDMVIAEVTEHPSARRPMRVRVVKVLGDPSDHEVLTQIILHEHEVNQEFPRSALDAAAACPDAIPPSEFTRRRDLRDWTCCTIDGETARDFDDAVSIRRLDRGGYELGVHIADVSWYVEEGSPLDLEAYDRGSSIYLPERAIPMLPERLSNNLCSLRPDRDRLTLSAIMRFDASGAVRDAHLCESIIHSRARLTYGIVQRFFNGVDGGTDVAAEVPTGLRDDLLIMRELAKLLRGRRMQAGSLDFDLPEPDFVFDESGNLAHIEELAADEAHSLIEEFMLAANQAVARQLRAASIPLPYRIHEAPGAKRVKALGAVVERFGYRFDVDPEAPSQKRLQEFLDSVRDTPEARILHTLALRTMKQARYDAINIGHFGLAFSLYTHFTSPIRRYPDLLVHRHLRRFVFQRQSVSRESAWHERFQEAAHQSSERERRAARVENAVNDLKTTAFMGNRLGEEYDGFITDLTSFGFFVELTALYVRGLVHLATLHDDHYLFDEDAYELVGVRTGFVFRLGDRVRIRVREIDLHRRRIDFELLSAAQEKARRKAAFRQKPRRGRTPARRGRRR